MTSTIILVVLVCQFVFAGVGFLVWRRSGTGRIKQAVESSPGEIEADSEQCQVLFGNIGQLLTSHNRFLETLDQPAGLAGGLASGSSTPNTFPAGLKHSTLLEERVDELGGILEKYDDLCLHERLHLKDYAGRAEEVECLLADIGSNGGEKEQQLIQLVRGMLRENQELRETVDHCRSRITELISFAVRSGKDARIDPLTQLPNRRAWIEQLTILDPNGNRSVAVVDLDDFKLINDQYGHAAGDAVLRLAAKIFRESLHALAFRNGGDEFYFVIEGRSLADAVSYLDSIRVRIERAGVLYDGKRLKATISGGVATPEPDEELSKTLKRADAALYEAKSAGKNRVLAAEPTNSRQASSQASNVSTSSF